jgi:[ribosomal protein S5]-alanine N-acetyltransferase
LYVCTVKLPPSTDRIAFRAWREDDLPLALALWGDAKVSALVGGPFDEAAVRERLAAELANQREHAIAYWPLVIEGGDAGCCGLKPKDLSRGLLELGFYLTPPHWGRGIAVEAGRAVIAHAFEVLDRTSLFAGHHPENHGSRRSLEKLGFRYTHHELYPPTQLMHPCYLLAR